MKKRSFSIWLACAACCAIHAQPTFEPTDLRYAVHLCSDTAFIPAQDQSMIGEVQDLSAVNRGCLLANEQQSVFVRFSVASAGLLAFAVTPTEPSDYDFALWGPFIEAVDTLEGSPIRCSYAALSGATGLSFQALDISESASGDGWVRHVSVDAGQHYVLYVGNYSLNGIGFHLHWQLEDGAALSCPGLPEAAFEPSVGTVGVGEEVSFVDLSTNDPYGWYWEFPGASMATSTDQFPQGITYATAGCYDVRLTAYNSAGAGETMTTCAVNVDATTGITAMDDVVGMVQDGRTLRFIAQGSPFFHVTVLDASGRTVQQEQGQGSMELPLTAHATGAYTVLVRTATGLIARRVAVIR